MNTALLDKRLEKHPVFEQLALALTSASDPWPLHDLSFDALVELAWGQYVEHRRTRRRHRN